MPKPTRTPERMEIGGGFNLKQLDNGNYTLHWADGERFNGAHVLSPQEAAALQSPAGEWRSMESAPKDTPVIVITQSGQVFKAHKTWCDEDCGWQWGTVEESDVCPNDWTDGACWSVNADEERSDWPVGWLPLPPAPTGEVE